MDYFLTYYELHRSSDDLIDKYRKDPTGKKCRFCGKAYPDVSFSAVPHVIPELFGKNNVTSNFECDNCNTRFQRYECDVATMAQHYLSLLRISTKHGVPTFQSHKKQGEQSTTLKVDRNTLRLDFGHNLSDFKYDHENKLFLVKFRTKNFKFYHVYKVFLKMGISLLTDEEIIDNEHYLDFLDSDEPIANGMQIWMAYRYVLKTKCSLSPKIDLYKAKDVVIGTDEFPEYILLISFANVMFQFCLPISTKNMEVHEKRNTLRYELFPFFVLDGITTFNIDEFKPEMFDLSLTEKGSFEDVVAFKYDKMIRNGEEITND